MVSIGNLSAGGTGKTPTTALLARNAPGQTLAVLRGYRGAAWGGLLVSDGAQLLSNFELAGDEAILLGRLPGLRVAAGKDRARLIAEFGRDCDVVLLDDAFQNPSVYRDHELVLLDASIPIEKLRVFPMGLFREDLRALQRAHTILLTRCDSSTPENLRALEEVVHSAAPAAEIFRSAHVVTGVVPEPPLKTVGAFCGLGNPEAFFHTVVSAGYQIVEGKAFPDHYPFRDGDLRALFGRDERLHWVVTEKDLVRLEGLASFEGFRARLHVLKIQLGILDGREGAFLERVFGVG